MKKNSARKQAQREVKAEKCVKCGETKNLQRHHEDYRKPQEVVILCQICHKNHHVANGTWAVRKKPRVCVVCDLIHYNGQSNAKTCSPKCFKELARRHARKRWDSNGV